MITKYTISFIINTRYLSDYPLNGFVDFCQTFVSIVKLWLQLIHKYSVGMNVNWYCHVCSEVRQKWDSNDMWELHSLVRWPTSLLNWIIVFNYSKKSLQFFACAIHSCKQDTFFNLISIINTFPSLYELWKINETNESLICSTCLFLWCKHIHHCQF